jgi:uncharacterized protein with von Willebrand factor type A (vWA) domain
MLTPQGEWFFKAGLAKSAFKSTICQNLPLDFFIPGIERTHRLCLLHRVRPRFFMTYDGFMMFYMPFNVVYRSLKEKNKAAPAWRAFVESIIMSPQYAKLNEMTQWSLELAAAAAASLLVQLSKTKVEVNGEQMSIEDLNEMSRSIAGGSAPPGAATNTGAVQELYKQIMHAAKEAGKAVAAKLAEVAEELRAYVEARREAEAAAAVLAGGEGYTLEGLSIWHFMQNPDEFRNRVRLLTSAASAFRRFTRTIPASLERLNVESPWGGIRGVTLMRQYSQLKEALPSELALAQIVPALFAVKLAQKSLAVYGHAADLKYVMFLDKSGSMADRLYGSQSVPKISLAAGLALALYRKTNAEVYLFDTEVERVLPREIVSTLLRIKADGGTNIGRVMEEVLRIDRPDNQYVIISDGITDAPPELVQQFISKAGKRTKLILIPPSGENYQWVQALKKLGNMAYAKDVAQFEEAARRIFT